MAFSMFKALLLASCFAHLSSGSMDSCSSGCPPFWTLFNKYCYRFFGQRVSWQEANYNCQTYGSGNSFANLVSIHSKEENEFVSNMFKSYTDNTDPTESGHEIWIGLTDQDEEGTFVWTDGTSADFTAWQSGEPNGGSREQAVIMLHPNSVYYKMWRDVHMETRQVRYICKMRCFAC
ncbi:Alpha-N-acetylgalactosamine-specific lectin [Holothuria leucospilota]|uniref:Alpha-N-acetylgalactosamine-specific lectin n=1 Tax=Holothuria leucospilota TaxID=206669 RepID=A0A9Q1BCT2_HOLLE|nr:Alpha-N-acetylgalactosamine-specific lectin [Holothuria leucospilota]